MNVQDEIKKLADQMTEAVEVLNRTDLSVPQYRAGAIEKFEGFANKLQSIARRVDAQPTLLETLERIAYSYHGLALGQKAPFSECMNTLCADARVAIAQAKGES